MVSRVLQSVMSPQNGVLRQFSGLLAVATACLLIALLADPGQVQLALTAVGLTLGLVAFGLGALHRTQTLGRAWHLRALCKMLARDPAPAFVTDENGVVRVANPALQGRMRAAGVSDPAALLAQVMAHPGASLLRLQRAASAEGSATERLGGESAAEALVVHPAGADLYLWRLERTPARGADPLGEDVAAMVIDDQGRVISASLALVRLLGGHPTRADTVLSPLPQADLQRVLLRPLVRAGFAGAEPPSDQTSAPTAAFRTDTAEDTVVHRVGHGPGARPRLTAVSGPRPVLAIAAPAAGKGLRRILLVPLGVQGGADAVPDAFETLPVALLRLMSDGAIVSANAVARQMLGLDPDAPAVLGERVEGLGRSLPDWLADVQAGRAASASEVVRMRGGGDDAFVQIALHTDPEGDGLIAVLSDATAIKTLEAQFVQSQKMQAIGQLAGGVAHDFNNLLAAIGGHCDLLLLRHKATDGDYPDLVQISQNTNRAAALVGQLLAFSRKQTLKSEQIDPAEVLSDMTHLLNRLVGARIKVILDCEGDTGPIRADRRQLEQVLMNLVVNARDAMPDGGPITISARAVQLGTALSRDRARVPPGDYALIRVADSGCGIPADRIDKIFEPFYTTKRPGEGTGLGLSTAYGIVKQTGGFIFADSEPGRGATFMLYFPVNRDVVPDHPRAVAAPPPVQLGQGVVLLVEDEAPVRAFAARALALRGYGVIEADSGEVALKMLQDPDLHVDVIVTDVIMPGLDGPAWVREALKDRPGVRVVFMSGYTDEGFEAARAGIPNSAFLPKPFSLEALVRLVQGQEPERLQ